MFVFSSQWWKRASLLICLCTCGDKRCEGVTLGSALCSSHSDYVGGSSGQLGQNHKGLLRVHGHKAVLT